MRQLVNIRANDEFVGNTYSDCVLCGTCAFARVGLTTLKSEQLEILQSTDYTSDKVITYAGDTYNDLSFTTVSPMSVYVHEPSRERAIVEYILYRQYFDEGVLIEGIQEYLSLYNDDVSALYPVAEHFNLHSEILDYWINEAREDNFTCNG